MIDRIALGMVIAPTLLGVASATNKFEFGVAAIIAWIYVGFMVWFLIKEEEPV